MAFPVNIAAAIEGLGLESVEGAYTQAMACEGSKFHSPSPLVVRSHLLADGSKVWLCGTCRDNLDVLTRIMDATEGQLAWPVRREFGNLIRELAERGTDA